MIILRVACLAVMAGCLLCEGALMAFMGFPLAGTSVHIYVVGFVWFATCISIVYGVIIGRPILAVIASWVFFLVSAITMWLYSSEEKTLVWFLYQHSLELCTIAAAQVLYFTSRTRKTHELV
jgi:hypothetical protein